MKHARPAAVASEGAAALSARIGAALLGNYGLTAGVGSLAAALLARAGVARVDAVTIVSILAFVLYLVLLLTAFNTTRVWRLWLAMAGVGVASYALALTVAGANP